MPAAPTVVRSAAEVAALEKLFSRIGEVSSLPTVALRIVNVASDETSAATDLVEAVESDPALAIKILRIINSTYYSIRHRVADLQTAITMLGFNQVRNLAMTVYVSRMFMAKGDYRQYSRESLWEHLLAVASTSRLIAEVTDKAPPNEVYTAGLLHDVGLILLDQHLRKHFRRVLDQVGVDVDTPLVEHEIFGFDHTELGEFVTRKWNFPEAISAAAGFHHHPERYAGPHRATVNIVSLANYLCARRDITSIGVQNIASPPNAVYSELELDAGTLEAILHRLDETLATASLTAQV